MVNCCVGRFLKSVGFKRGFNIQKLVERSELSCFCLGSAVCTDTLVGVRDLELNFCKLASMSVQNQK